MTSERKLNWFGMSLETIAAQYETDQALVEANNNFEDPYFLAAWAAENTHRQLDAYREDDPSTHPINCTCIFCIPGA